MNILSCMSPISITIFDRSVLNFFVDRNKTHRFFECYCCKKKYIFNTTNPYKLKIFVYSNVFLINIYCLKIYTFINLLITQCA